VTEPETSYRDAASVWATFVLNQWFDAVKATPLHCRLQAEP